jgi:ABC-2 type transport system ATP-binding protein
MSPHVEFVESLKLGGRIKIDTTDPTEIAVVLRKMINEGLAVTEFHKEERKLEDAFIDMLGKLEIEDSAPVITEEPE